MRPIGRIVFRLALAAVALACIALIVGLVMVQTDWFQNRVRARIISAAEQATGGRVEIGSFSYDWRQLTATVAPFVLHGTEAAGESPLFRADTVHVRLKIISVLQQRVELARLSIERPQVRITVGANGRTNFPVPKIQPHQGKSFVQQLLQLKVRDLALQDGFVEYDSRRIPLDVRARDLDANLRYEAAGPRYAGEVTSRSLIFDSGPLHGAAFSFASGLAIENNKLRFANTHLRMGQSSIELAGVMEDFASPHGLFECTAELFPVEVARAIKLPIENRGQLSFRGQAAFSSLAGFEYSLEGNVTGHGLAFENKNVRVNGIALASPFKLTKDRIELHGAILKALGGEFRGRADILDLKKLLVDGTVQGLSISQLAQSQGQQSGILSGIVTGPVHLQSAITAAGPQAAQFDGKLDVSPGGQGVPVRGFLDLHYEQAGNMLQLSNSTIDTGASHAEVSGKLGDNLTVHATSKNLNDILAAFPLFGAAPPTLPVTLDGGTATFDGNVVGPLKNPRFTGHVEATRFILEKRNFDRLVSDFDISRSIVIARSLDLDQGGLHVQVAGSLGLLNWTSDKASAIAAKVTIRGADIQTLLRETATLNRESKGGAPPIAVTGSVSATANVKGTLGSPSGTAHVDGTNVAAYNEKADHIQADLKLEGTSLDILNARVTAGKAQLDAKGSYNHQGTDWTTGTVHFDVATHNLALLQSGTVQKIRDGLNGLVEGHAVGTARLVKGEFRLDSLDSRASVNSVTLDGHPYGNLNFSATTKGAVLAVHGTGNLRGTPLEGSGEWRLEGDYPGHGEIVIPRITVSTLHGFVPDAAKPELPFEGFIEGKIDVSGPLRIPDLLKADVRLTTVQINSRQNVRLKAGAQERDLVLRNVKPVILEATTKNIDIKSAEFAGFDTTLQAQGRMSVDAKNPWDVRLNGSINLAILQLFNPDLLASGNATVNATVRGGFAEPDISGRLELKNASLYLTDLPNGLDQANGIIFFDKNRATVNRLSAITGGGQISFQPGSFVGFRGPSLVYRVQGAADHVRYRSPEGVSITVNAVMSLLGTSENSVLSGTVTVMRAGFNPKTDVGSLLATTTKPVSTPSAPNPYLRGIQYDIRVESSQSLEIETSLTRNIEAEANLRVRGTPDRPVVLGNLSVNEGEIEFFGNRYAINRGEVNFYNTAKLEPIIDMDLETSVRGVTVDIAFSGPLNKLNFSYRSDPPLQTNDIIALLAVGRAPTATSGLSNSQTTGNTNYLSTGNNALLGQAISAPVAGRLQRFFGVSHLKIDPQLTDLTSVPQARVTLEQQISKDVTLTYITNLTRTQEQIIRVEWDLSRQWSVIALRDENGAFGVDVQYRKRFR